VRNNIIHVSEEEIALQKDFTNKIKDYNKGKGKTPTAFVDTYGCQQNEADSERIRGMLAAMGFEMAKDENADVVIINTCAVREHAEQRVFGNIGALVHKKRKNPDMIIGICGCMAQQQEVADRVKKSFRHVDLVFGTHSLWKFPQLVWELITKRKRVFSVEDIDGFLAEDIPVMRGEKPNAWVSIMYGCNNFCTYCIVPYVRGRERSRRREDILNEVRELVAEGYKCITLLGQNVNSYGKDLYEGYDFSDLLHDINAIDGEFWVRFMTSHPKDASSKLFKTMAECEKIESHLHLPFQSGDDEILRRMNRGYTAEKYLSKIAQIRELVPDIVLTSDVIVGFPNETEEQFDKTLLMVKTVGFDALFTFIYSKRPHTPAESMEDNTTREEKNNRFNRLLEVQNETSCKKHAQYVGKVVRVLVDGVSTDNKSLLVARTKGGRLVRLNGDKSLIGRFINVKVISSSMWALEAEIID